MRLGAGWALAGAGRRRQQSRGKGMGEPALVSALGPASLEDEVEVVARADMDPGDLRGGVVVEFAAQRSLAGQRGDESPRGGEPLLFARRDIRHQPRFRMMSRLVTILELETEPPFGVNTLRQAALQH